MSDADPKKDRSKTRKKERKEKKPSFFKRMANRGRELKALGVVLVNQPRQFPSELLKLLRRSARTIWDARGGGLYACGFLLTFIYLEVLMIFSDIFEADSVGGYFSEQIGEMLFKYIGESFRNTISAFMWPVRVIELDPTWGGILLVAMFYVFPKFLKNPIERWLFGNSENS